MKPENKIYLGSLLQTSDNWQIMYPELTILDPDGWDRSNYQFSWFEERITLEEFKNRVFQSTIEIRK